MGAFVTSVDPNSSSEITGSGTANTIAMFTSAQVIGNSVITQGIGGVAVDISPTVATSGNVTAFNITQAANTGQSATTEINGTKFLGASRQWATGAITTQREHYWSTTTYTSVGASVITNAYGGYFEAPTASTNVTITNNWAIGATGAISSTVGYGVGAVPSSTRPINISASVAGEYSIFITNLGNGASTSSGVRFGNNSNESTILHAATSATTGNGLYAYGLNFRNNDYGFAFNQSGNGPVAGALTRFRIWGTGALTNQTLSTEIPGFINSSLSRQWATGAITTQREVYFQTATYSFVGASTITNAYGLYVEAATVGSNATITNNYGLGVSGQSLMQGRVRVVATANLGISMDTVSAATNRFRMFCSDGSSGLVDQENYIQSGNTTLHIQGGGSGITEMATFAYTGLINFLPLAVTSGTGQFLITQAANTGQTALTEISGFKFLGASRQWNTGAITTQRETYFSTTTYTAVGASVITNAYGAYFEAPTASTNVTITNNWAAGFSGNLSVSGNSYFGSLTTAATAFVTIAAGTTGVAQIRLTPGVAPSSPNDGDVYYINTNDRLMFFKNATACEVISASAVTTEVIVSDTSLTITFNGANYKLLATALP